MFIGLTNVEFHLGYHTFYWSNTFSRSVSTFAGQEYLCGLNITDRVYFKLISDKSEEYFSQEEFDSLKDKFENISTFTYKVHGFRTPNSFKCHTFILRNIKIDFGRYPNEICIDKLLDEWFIVRIEYHLSNQIYGYYKCDGFDGLKELLKDKDIIN